MTTHRTSSRLCRSLSPFHWLHSLHQLLVFGLQLEVEHGPRSEHPAATPWLGTAYCLVPSLPRTSGWCTRHAVSLRLRQFLTRCTGTHVTPNSAATASKHTMCMHAEVRNTCREVVSHAYMTEIERCPTTGQTSCDLGCPLGVCLHHMSLDRSMAATGITLMDPCSRRLLCCTLHVGPTSATDAPTCSALCKPLL